MIVRTLLTTVLVVSLACPSVAWAQTIWHVDDDADGIIDGTTWENAFKELQSALAAAQAGDHIWVAEGTYTPTGEGGDREATFQLTTGVAVYGGFDGTEIIFEDRAGLFDQTILSGDLAGDDVASEFPNGPSFSENSFHVVDGSATVTAILDGFTISGGNANVLLSGHDRGAGVRCVNGRPTINNCRIAANSALRIGGGLYCGSGSKPRISNCTISHNVSSGRGGGIHASNSRPVISNCRISDNATFFSGGGIDCERSSPTILACHISHNTSKCGGGIYIGGGGFIDTASSITNCIITSNTASSLGGGLALVRNDTLVTNCTITRNEAGDAGGGVITASNAPVFSNCILWNDSSPLGPEMYLWHIVIHHEPTVLSMAYSDVEGGLGAVFVEHLGFVIWGTGNIDVDPMFVDQHSGEVNLRLRAGSPCIDSADNSAVPPGVVTDLDGNPRFMDDPDTPDTGSPVGDAAVVDMGAYEFQPGDFCNDDDGDGKVTICHVPPGNPDNARTISVSVNAVDAHLAHGDSCGPCGQPSTRGDLNQPKSRRRLRD